VQSAQETTDLAFAYVEYHWHWLTHYTRPTIFNNTDVFMFTDVRFLRGRHYHLKAGAAHTLLIL